MEITASPRQRAATAGVFAALVFIPVLFFSSMIAGREISRLYALAWALFTAGAAYAINYSGRVSFYRRIFFSVSALAFLVHFKFSLFSKVFTASCFTDTPFCHIAMAPYFLNYLYQQYLALMSGGWKLWGPLTLGAAWLFLTIALGRGWCSWVCFYGGIDDGLSSLARRQLIQIDRWALKVRDLPAALLIFIMLVSLAYMLPVYCLWLCPFKITGSFLDQEGYLKGLQYGLMFFAMAAVVIGPLLTKKRIFCSFLCPFAAWQAFWGRLNPFRISAEEAKCIGCLNCVAACPMSAKSCAPGGKPEILAYCNLCGQCLEACPVRGIRYTVLGLELPAAEGVLGRLVTVECFFVFSALTLGSVFASLWAPAALRDVVKIMSH
ncbi:MAG: 4Fe-4S binding protein [Elusimicrobiota bacterium]|nr:4Fe-4S binding protein [Elusimicrobiota bacterium]